MHTLSCMPTHTHDYTHIHIYTPLHVSPYVCTHMHNYVTGTAASIDVHYSPPSKIRSDMLIDIELE